MIEPEFDSNLAPEEGGGRSPATRLTWLYVLALSLIALLTITGQVVIQYSLDRQRADYRIINLAGRQRMLSRALSENSLSILLATDTAVRDQAAARLRKYLAIFEESHQALVHGSADLGLDGTAKPDILQLFAELEPLRQEMVQAGRRLLDGLDKGLNPDQLAKASEAVFKGEEFVTLMDRIVTRYELDATEKVNRLKRLELVLGSVVLLVLVLEALFVFRPAVDRIRKTMAALQEAAERMRRQSLVDGLTGLANRRFLDEFLAQEWKRAVRNRTSLAVIMLDVDYFKRYNDSRGHLEGDRVLIQVAQAVKKTLQRPTDLAARYGGEEFVAVLPGTDGQGAWHVAEAIRRAVLDLKIPHGDSPVSPYVTVSVGLAGLLTAPLSGGSPGLLLEAADQALYQAKMAGRNTCRLADPAIEQRPAA